jgi:HEAT repeat protein
MRRALSLLAVGVFLGSACRAKEKPRDAAQLVAQLSAADPKTSGAARLALITLGEPAVPALAEKLRSGTPAERLAALNTFWGLGAKGRAATLDLAATLADADPALCVAAAMALENMGPPAAPAVPGLIQALDRGDPATRQAAVKALGAIGPAAAEAVPLLVRALRRGSWPEAEEAVRRIRGLHADAPIDLGKDPGTP